MKRKILALLVAILMFVTVFGPALASASGNGNDKNYQKACSIVLRANQQIEQYVQKAQRTEQDDVAWLLRKTQSTADNAAKQVRKLGYDTVCEYVEYYVDGQWVLIDPLHVVNPLD